MSEREKQVVEKLKEAIPKMSDFDKGYIHFLLTFFLISCGI
jgi:hypothetical protein